MKVSVTVTIDETANKALAERTGDKKLSRIEVKELLTSLLDADISDIVGDYLSRVDETDLSQGE